MEVGGIKKVVGVAALLQGPVQEGLHLDVDVSTDAACLGFGDAALDAQGRHHRIHLAGGDATDVRLHHHAIESLINAAAGFEDRGQETARPQLRDLQMNVAHLGGEQPGPVAVALTKPVLTAFMAIGAEHGGNLQLDQLLQAVAH